jgi:hypothetical protein
VSGSDLIAPGRRNDLQLIQVFHVTYDADGDLVTMVDIFSVGCK